MTMVCAFQQRRLIGAALLFAAPLLLSGCMLGMHGLGHDGTMAPRGEARAVVNTVETERLRVTLELPPMTTGTESRLTVRVAHAQTGAPVARAEVDLQIRPPDGTVTEHRAAENASTGVYVLQHRFGAAGEYEFRVRVQAGPEIDPATVTATQSVADAPAGGMDRGALAAVAVGVGMVAMMLILMVAL